MDEKKANLRARVERSKAQSEENLNNMFDCEERLMDLREMIGLSPWPENGTMMTAIEEVIEFLQTTGMIEAMQPSQEIVK